MLRQHIHLWPFRSCLVPTSLQCICFDYFWVMRDAGCNVNCNCKLHLDIALTYDFFQGICVRACLCCAAMHTDVRARLPACLRVHSCVYFLVCIPAILWALSSAWDAWSVKERELDCCTAKIRLVRNSAPEPQGTLKR